MDHMVICRRQIYLYMYMYIQSVTNYKEFQPVVRLHESYTWAYFQRFSYRWMTMLAARYFIALPQLVTKSQCPRYIRKITKGCGKSLESLVFFLESHSP